MAIEWPLLSRDPTPAHASLWYGAHEPAQPNFEFRCSRVPRPSVHLHSPVKPPFLPPFLPPRTLSARNAAAPVPSAAQQQVTACGVGSCEETPRFQDRLSLQRLTSSKLAFLTHPFLRPYSDHGFMSYVLSPMNLVRTKETLHRPLCLCSHHLLSLNRGVSPPGRQCLSLPFHCPDTTFRCPATAFRCPSTAFSLPFLALPLLFHCLSLTLRVPCTAHRWISSRYCRSTWSL